MSSRSTCKDINYYFQFFTTMKRFRKIPITCDRSDIHFLKPIYRITNFLSLTPYYDFEKKCLIRVKQSYICAILTFTAFLFGNAYSLYTRHVLYVKTFKSTHKILDYTNDIILFAGISTAILNSCIFGRDYWIRLNKNLEKVDEDISKLCSKSYNEYSLTPCFVFVFRVGIFILIRIYVFYVWRQHIGALGVAKTYLAHSIGRIYNVTTVELVITISSAFRCRYKKLGNILEQQNVNEMQNNLKKIGQIFRMLTEGNKCFNSIFGWVLLFITGKEVTQLLECLNYSVAEIPLIDKRFERGLAIESVIQLIYTTVKSFTFKAKILIIFLQILLILYMTTCNNATSASKELSFICYKLQDKVTKPFETAEILNLAHEFESNILKFSAADFFEINNCTLFGIFASTVTYFVIIIQFNSAVTTAT